MADKKKTKFKIGMECVPGHMKEEGETVFVCNDRGKWEKRPKEKKVEDPAAKRMQQDINRLFPGLSK